MDLFAPPVVSLIHHRTVQTVQASVYFKSLSHGDVGIDTSGLFLAQDSSGLGLERQRVHMEHEGGM